MPAQQVRLVPDACRPGTGDGTEFDLADPATAEADVAANAAEVETARLAVAGRSLDEQFGDESHTVDLRWLYAHVLDEYIRRNGHADLIRGFTTGTTGYAQLRPRPVSLMALSLVVAVACAFLVAVPLS